MRSRIRIKFVDFWSTMEPNKFIIYRQLKEMFDVDIVDDPDYLIYSTFGREHLDGRYDDCIKIFFTGECQVPDFNICDYAIGFDYMDMGDRYIRLPIYFNTTYRNDLQKLFHKHECAESKLRAKNGFCSFVYSNENADVMRKYIFEGISKYKRVCSGGRFLNNTENGMPVSDKIAFERNFKFSIACENTSYPGYTTEKIIQSFAAGTVPIYWGDPLIKRVFNPKSMICVSDFHGMNDLVSYIEQVDKNDDIYLNHLSSPAIEIGEEYTSIQMQALDRWLKHIFEQDKKDAFRRPHSFWTKYYEKNFISAANITKHDVKGWLKLKLKEKLGVQHN